MAASDDDVILSILIVQSIDARRRFEDEPSPTARALWGECYNAADAMRAGMVAKHQPSSVPVENSGLYQREKVSSMPAESSQPIMFADALEESPMQLASRFNCSLTSQSDCTMTSSETLQSVSSTDDDDVVILMQ